LPTWDAVTEQLPAFTGVSVVPLTVQISGVVLVKPTVRPLPAVAVSVYEGAVALSESTGVKVMV
jgi:hypothetical protein